MDYLKQIQDKRQAQSHDQLLRALGTQKPSVILTDSTDLGEHIAALGEKIIHVMQMVQADKSTKEQIDRFGAEFKTLADLARKTTREQSEMVREALNELKDIIRQQKPIVVPAPRVSLQEKAVDFNPVLEKLDALMPKQVSTFNMASYRAHDLDNAPDNMQYIGFENEDGDWYIMRHNATDNRDRFYFGSEDYATAWDERISHEYKTLSEARRALRS